MRLKMLVEYDDSHVKTTTTHEVESEDIDFMESFTDSVENCLGGLGLEKKSLQKYYNGEKNEI